MSAVTLKILFAGLRGKIFLPAYFGVWVSEAVNYDSDCFYAHACLGPDAFTADNLVFVLCETFDKG